MDDAEKYAEHIKKTGFLLEFHVARTLEKNGRGVIMNKYYVDDVHENVRQIDLVAYKASDVANFKVYTMLIVSCKKSDD